MSVPPAGAERIQLCIGCQPGGRCRFGIDRLWLDADQALHANLRCPNSEQGGPGVAHGGWTAAVFDDFLGRVPNYFGAQAVTKSLQVDYLRPVPVEADLLARAWVERREGRYWHVAGALHMALGGAELARASGVWVERRDDHFERHQQWLARQVTGAKTA